MAEWLGFQPLSNFTILETLDVDAARAEMANIYGDVTLNPVGRNTSFSLCLNAVPVGRLLITSHRWGHGVDAGAPFLDGCFDLCSALQGAAEVRIGSRVVEFAPERGVVMAPIHPMQCKTKEGLLSLNVKVPKTLAEAHVRALTGRELSEPLDFEADMPVQGEIASFWRLVHYVSGELERTPSLLGNRLVMERFAESLLTTLFCSQPGNYSQWLQREMHPAEPRYVREIEEYLEARLEEPITARKLAEIAGVSMSALYAGFKRHRGYTPFGFLKRLRLRAVRDELLSATSETTVKAAASRWGFTHPGRFGQDYQAEFGELPSETLRRTGD